MFIYKFSPIKEGQLITRVKINGFFISLYVAKEDLAKFSDLYIDKICDEGYTFLSEGEGVMHDNAHNKTNKHIDSLARLFGGKKGKTEHFHIMCANGLVTEKDLSNLLSLIKNVDLSPIEKENVLTAYKDYLSQPSFSHINSILLSYGRLLAALTQGDFYIKERMPLLSAINSECDSYIEDNEIANPDNVPDDASIHVQGYVINLKQCYKFFILIAEHVGHLLELQEVINKYATQSTYQAQNSTEQALSGSLLEQIKEIAEKIKRLPMANLADFLPEIAQELIANLPYADLNELYAVLSRELSLLLGTPILFQHAFLPATNGNAISTSSSSSKSAQTILCELQNDIFNTKWTHANNWFLSKLNVAKVWLLDENGQPIPNSCRNVPAPVKKILDFIEVAQSIPEADEQIYDETLDRITAILRALNKPIQDNNNLNQAESKYKEWFEKIGQEYNNPTQQNTNQTYYQAKPNS